MKKRIATIVFLFIAHLLFAYDFYPFGFSIDFSDQIEDIEQIKGPFFAGYQDGYYVGYFFKIRYKNIVLDASVKALIDEEIIPVSIKSKPILNSFFSDDFYNYQKVLNVHENYYDKRYGLFQETEKRFLNNLGSYTEDLLTSSTDIEINRNLQFDNSMYINQLTYFFKYEYGIYSEYSITFFDIYNVIDKVGSLEYPDYPITTFSGDYDETVNLYTFTNEQLENYPDQDNDRIQLMYLLNQAMETLQFDKELLVSQGSVNDKQVRVRSDNSLSSEILGHVNTGEEVIILDRSESIQAIGDMNDYWYRIISKDSYLKGWMYGAFLELQE
jgi:hypothetical protein